MRIVIIGASGLIGRNLYAAARSSGRKVVGTCHIRKNKELVSYDMRSQSLRSVLPDINSSDVVCLLSAYSNPSWIYNNQDEAFQLNLFATKRLINEVFEVGARLIFMSSVEVFDGKEGNYNEKSSPGPINLYGKMKFEIENYLLEKGGKSCIVRTGWNVGWDFNDRCVIRLTYNTLIHPEAKMAKDNIFSIIDVRDTVEGLLRLCDNPGIRVCHLASNPSIVRTELASLIMNFSKYKDLMAYEVVLFSDIPYSEPRGRCNHLDNSFAISSLGINFRPPKEIIRQKVELLDRHIADIKSAPNGFV